MMGTMELLLPVTADHAPMTQILAYILPGNGQIIADTEMFHVTKCFKNKVNQFLSEPRCPVSGNMWRIIILQLSFCLYIYFTFISKIFYKITVDLLYSPLMFTKCS